MLQLHPSLMLVESRIETNFPQKASLLSCAWGLWLSCIYWEQHGLCPSFTGAGQNSLGEQPSGENGTQTQGKALRTLMLSRLETKRFMPVQQIETKHSFLRNVKMLHFDPKNVKTEHGDISEHDCLNSRKLFFLIFFVPVCSALENRNSKFHTALLRAIYQRRYQCCLYTHVYVRTLIRTHSTSSVPFSGIPRPLSRLLSPI